MHAYDVMEAPRTAWANGTAPLDYLPGIMQDETIPVEVRLFAAKAALPYCPPPRLAAVRVEPEGGGRSHEEWVRVLSEALDAA